MEQATQDQVKSDGEAKTSVTSTTGETPKAVAPEAVAPEAPETVAVQESADLPQNQGTDEPQDVTDERQLESPESPAPMSPATAELYKEPSVEQVANIAVEDIVEKGVLTIADAKEGSEEGIVDDDVQNDDVQILDESKELTPLTNLVTEEQLAAKAKDPGSSTTAPIPRFVIVESGVSSSNYAYHIGFAAAVPPKFLPALARSPAVSVDSQANQSVASNETLPFESALGAEVDIDDEDESHVETIDDEAVQVAEKDYTFDELKAMGLGAALKLVAKTQDAIKKAYYVEAMKILIENDKKRKRSGSSNESLSAAKKSKLEKNKKGKKEKRKEKAGSSNAGPKVDDKKPKEPSAAADGGKDSVDDKKPKTPKLDKPRFFTCAKSLSEKETKSLEKCAWTRDVAFGDDKKRLICRDEGCDPLLSYSIDGYKAHWFAVHRVSPTLADIDELKTILRYFDCKRRCCSLCKQLTDSDRSLLVHLEETHKEEWAEIENDPMEELYFELPPIKARYDMTVSSGICKRTEQLNDKLFCNDALCNPRLEYKAAAMEDHYSCHHSDLALKFCDNPLVMSSIYALRDYISQNSAFGKPWRCPYACGLRNTFPDFEGLLDMLHHFHSAHKKLLYLLCGWRLKLWRGIAARLADEKISLVQAGKQFRDLDDQYPLFELEQLRAANTGKGLVDELLDGPRGPNKEPLLSHIAQRKKSISEQSALHVETGGSASFASSLTPGSSADPFSSTPAEKSAPLAASLTPVSPAPVAAQAAVAVQAAPGVVKRKKTLERKVDAMAKQLGELVAFVKALPKGT